MAFGFGKARDGRIGPVSVKDVVGKLFNAPNTALGVAYGALGHAAGEVGYAVGAQPKRPEIAVRDNAIQFLNNPFGGVSAITIGNSTTYNGDPYDPHDKFWYPNGEDPQSYDHGHSAWEHEKQHTLQGQQLGPFYLPSNLAGGLTALFHDRDPQGRPDWHGPSNWNERGPQANPARPWAPRPKP